MSVYHLWVVTRVIYICLYFDPFQLFENTALFRSRPAMVVSSLAMTTLQNNSGRNRKFLGMPNWSELTSVKESSQSIRSYFPSFILHQAYVYSHNSEIPFIFFILNYTNISTPRFKVSKRGAGLPAGCCYCWRIEDFIQRVEMAVICIHRGRTGACIISRSEVA